MAKKLKYNNEDIVAEYAVKDSHGTELNQSYLQDQIDNLKSRGRYLSNWNSVTGLAMTNPTALPYDYRAGDYFIVGTVDYEEYNSSKTYNTGDKVIYNNARYVCKEDSVTGEWDSTKWETTTLVLYKPDGTSYTGVASTTVETGTVQVSDEYLYDGTQWVFQKTAPVDLSNYVDLTSAQTISGEKVFENLTYGAGSNNWKFIPDISTGYQLLLKRGTTTHYRFHSSFFAPQTNNSKDLGTSTEKWKDLYLSGIISDGTNSATVESLIKDKMPYLNKSVGNTLTEEEFNIAKRTGFIADNLILFKPCGKYGTDEMFFGIKLSYNLIEFGGVKINDSTRAWALQRKVGGFNSSTSQIELLCTKFTLFNKTFPSYPSSPTNDKVLTYKTDNTLSWEDNLALYHYDTLPTASATNLGAIYQYSGETDSNYTNGHFYKVVALGTEPETYGYEEIKFGSDNGFNVINASDIASNLKLTQAQYDLITNGKPTIINGSISGFDNIFIRNGKFIGQGYYTTCFATGPSGQLYVRRFSINQYMTATIGDEVLDIYSLAIRGKSFPNYPSTNIDGDFAYLNNNMIWKAAPIAITDNSITELDYYKTNVLTLGANKTFTFKATPAITGTNLSYRPEYKAVITTTAAITITLPSGTYKLLSNDDSITLSQNVLSLPTDSEIEISIQNGKIVAMNWSI